MLRQLFTRSTTDVDPAYLPEGVDGFDMILAPDGVESGGDAGALALPGYYRGVAVKAGMISSIPLRWQVNGKLQPLAASPPIIRQPDPGETVAVTIKRMVSTLVMRGNAIAPLDGWDDLGYPTVLRVVHPNTVTAERRGDGVFYMIGGAEYRADQVLHTRGLTIGSSLMGVSPLEACARALLGARAVESYGRTYFRANGVPSAHFKVNRPREQVNADELAALSLKYANMMAGVRRPIWTAADIDIEPFEQSNEDSQFLETRKYNLTDIANIVGIPGYFIGADGSSRTYNNAQDERRALIDIYLREEMEAIEDAFTALIPYGEAKFDTASFLRMDQRATAETLKIEMAWMTMDEVRAVQGLDPIPGGDVIAAHYTPPIGDAGGVNVPELVRMLQQIYLAVDVVISAEEARSILNKAGAELVGAAPNTPALSAAPAALPAGDPQ